MTEETRARPETHFLEAGGARLEYRWIGPAPGDAPTLVFLHEGLGSVSLWRDFPDRLAAETGCGALVYSRAGYGRSDPVALPRPVRFMHHEARVLTERAARHRRSATRCWWATATARPSPSSTPGARGTPVRALVLEAPHVFTEPGGLESIAAIADVYRTTGLATRLRRHHGDNTDVGVLRMEPRLAGPGFRAWNMEAYLPRIAVPTLIIQGEDDEYGTWRQVEAIERQCGGTVAALRVPGGHAPHAEHPRAVLEAMAEFVRRVLHLPSPPS
jgi:pimeloyl-ACP methyl ester carboxylesterase